MKLYRITLMVKEYEESRSDTTRKVISGFLYPETFDVPAASQQLALMKVNSAAYAEKHKVKTMDIAFVIMEASIHDLEPES